MSSDIKPDRKPNNNNNTNCGSNRKPRDIHLEPLVESVHVLFSRTSDDGPTKWMGPDVGAGDDDDDVWLRHIETHLVHTLIYGLPQNVFDD